ncbi:NAD/NADP octopine/nopaline dehydrogenase family protein [Brevibacillus sp. B_LB10_24]|uniref:NAD/NADP octopine/nopaline dehydrogenase family protein n=1 Tax=Brevibacillus sp. B_LB10_24 TaxID=3380645 RepID=UPI0038BA6D6D
MKFAIIGAGNGGQSMAAHLTLSGQEISLYDIQTDLVKKINQLGGITAEGVVNGFASITATTNLGEAVRGADAIMITTTAAAHQHVARSIAQYLEENQIIMIFPGYWGALEFANVLEETGINKRVILAETESLIYTCRYTEPGRVHIRKVKDSLEFATFPSGDAAEVVERLKAVYPQLVPTNSIVRTTLNNVNPVFHVPITLLNTGRIESEGDFFFYPDGASPSVVNVVEEIDRERMALGRALGVELSTSLELLRRFYQVEADSLYEGIQSNQAYRAGRAPTTLRYRYIYEDIPYGLIPMVELGERLGLKMPGMNLLIDLASIVMKENLREKGLHLSNLGLADLSKEEIVRLLS